MQGLKETSGFLIFGYLGVHVSNGKNDDNDDDDRPFYQQPVESYSTTIIVLGMTKLMKWEKPTEVSMAKPIVPAVVELYGKTHEMGKPTEVSMAKPIAPSMAALY